jgi:mycothiol synthase
VTAGFERAATLCYLATESAGVPDEQSTGMSFVPFDDSQTDRLAAIIEQTYEGTLDCPQLNGVRTTQEVLAGYRATGRFSPARWLIVRQGDRDIGCLLLTDHPDATSPELSSWELVYMGLIPAARGHGWGLSMARHGIRLAAAAGRSTIALAVDEANSPALATYARAGFCHLGQKAVFLKVTKPPP